MIIVLDTNVLVAGLLSPFGPPAEILMRISAGDLRLCIDARILLEYREVLARPKFDFPAADRAVLLDFIESEGIPVAPRPLAKDLPDPDDNIFLEAAVAGRAEALVTGNRKHFPDRLCAGILVTTPKDFLDLYRKIR